MPHKFILRADQAVTEILIHEGPVDIPDQRREKKGDRLGFFPEHPAGVFVRMITQTRADGLNLLPLRFGQLRARIPVHRVRDRGD